MDRRVLILLAVTSLLAVVAFRATAAGGALGWTLGVTVAVGSALGLAALGRIAYLDGVAGRERTARVRSIRRRI